MGSNRSSRLLTDQSLAVQQVLNWSCFLVPEDIKDGSVVHAETTTTQVKISWTNPPSSGGVTVVRGAATQVITDSTVSEHVFTGLSADDFQICTITTKGSDDCSSEEAAKPFSIQNCNTKCKRTHGFSPGLHLVEKCQSLQNYPLMIN